MSQWVRVDRSHLKRFMDRHGIATFDEPIERSPTDLEWFCNAVMEDLDIES